MHLFSAVFLATCLSTGTLSRTPSTQPEGFSLREAWIGSLQIGPFEAVLQFRIEATAAGETRAYFDSISEKRTGLDAEWRIGGDELAFDVASVGATYRGRLNAAHTQSEGRFSQGGRERALTLERRTSVYQPEFFWEARPQRPEAPFPYSAHEVKIDNEHDGLTLAGTLTIPEGAGRHPAVVLISGSGPQDRDETLVEHKPFLVLADYLTRRGIAVLRYDDRGTAGSSGNFSSATTADFARDAAAVVDFLRAHARIDPARIGLVGHSEGGLVAPLVAAERKDVALVALLAAPGVPGATIVREQSVSIARAEGASEVSLRLQQAVTNAIVTIVEGAAPDAELAGEIERAVADLVATRPDEERALASAVRSEFLAQLPTFTSAWFRNFVRHDPRTVLRRVHCPVLAIAGSMDVQVAPTSNLAEIERALAQGGNQDHQIVELPGLNHMFQACESGAVSKFISIPETLNPVALETIEHWIAKRFLK
jgi:pimeloyl-ACP methyl ester carboxylesterase